MKFTLVFESDECEDISYGLVFTPVPVWVKGKTEIAAPDRGSPHYQLGHLRALLRAEGVTEKLPSDSRRCVLVVHPLGHGTEEDLDALESDLAAEGFSVTKVAI